MEGYDDETQKQGIHETTGNARACRDLLGTSLFAMEGTAAADVAAAQGDAERGSQPSDAVA